MYDKVKGMQADLCGRTAGRSGYHRFIKRQKLKLERRCAKHNPECAPGYGLYKAWES